MNSCIPPDGVPYTVHQSGTVTVRSQQKALPSCQVSDNFHQPLTHWGQVTHICVSKLTIIGADNGLSPGQRQAIIWTNAGILLIGPLGTNFSENSIGMQTFSFKKMSLKMSSAKWRPFCLGLNVLNDWVIFFLKHYSSVVPGIWKFI